MESMPRTDVVSCSTFDGVPYEIVLERHPFRYGSSAQIRKGQVLNKPIVVAVKVFGAMLDHVRQELLARELRFASEVSSSHIRILKYLGTATVGGQAAIVSLYMGNGNMMDYMKAHPGCDKKKLIVQVAEAVEYLHGPACLVHGDLKCSNVLISDDGDAVLADFGLSTSSKGSQLARQTMATIRKMTTPQFAAPELLANENATPASKTRESDVYAFGMLILEALSEKLPWPHQTLYQLMRKVCSGIHPARPTIDGAFVSFSHSWWNECLRCWSFKSCDRPPINIVLSALRDTNPTPWREFCFHEDIITNAYSPDGNTMVGGLADGSVVQYNIVTGQTRDLVRLGDTDVALSIAVSPNAQRIASASDTVVTVWDAASGARITSMEHGCWVACIACSPDGARIASGGLDGTLQLWDAATGTTSGYCPQGHTSEVTCVSFAPDGRSVASGSYDERIILRNSVTGTASGALRWPCNGGAVFSVCFVPDGAKLISGHRRDVIVWDVPSQSPVRIIDSHFGAGCVTLSHETKCIASESPGGDICILDFKHRGQIGATLVGHTESIRSLAFSPDGKTLVSASYGHKIRVWDLFA